MISRTIKTCLVTISLAILISAWFGCASPNEPEFNNPLIPEDPGYIPPTVSFISAPEEGVPLDTADVHLAWEGNQANMEFSFRLDNVGWSQWSGLDEVIHYDLDEGLHMFEILGRYALKIVSEDTLRRAFQVDAIHGPALWISPRRQEANTSDIGFVNLMFEDIVDMMAAKVVLEYNPDFLQVLGISMYQDSGSLLRSTGGTVISFTDYDNTTGRATIELSVAGGDPQGVCGTGQIARVTYQVVANVWALSSPIVIAISDSSTLRDPDNTPISISEKVRGLIVPW